MTILESLIKSRETEAFKFKPDRNFYKTIKIGQKRFWMIIEGKVSPTVPEIKRIVETFKGDLETVIKSI